MSRERIAERYCPKCGAPARTTAQFCGQCRAQLRPLADPSFHEDALPAPGRSYDGPPQKAGWNRPFWRRPLVLALLGLLLLGLAGGMGAYIKLGWRLVAPAPPASTLAPAPTQPPPPSPVDTPIIPVSTETPTPSEEAAILRAMQGHWDAIRGGRFDEAYAYLGPNLAKGQASWVSSHERDGITDIQYNFSVRDVNGDTATVDIVKLQTKAQSAKSGGNPEGCLSWTGNYVLIRQTDRWLINQANVSSTPC